MPSTFPGSRKKGCMQMSRLERGSVGKENIKDFFLLLLLLLVFRSDHTVNKKPEDGGGVGCGGDGLKFESRKSSTSFQPKGLLKWKTAHACLEFCAQA